MINQELRAITKDNVERMWTLTKDTMIKPNKNSSKNTYKKYSGRFEEECRTELEKRNKLKLEQRKQKKQGIVTEIVYQKA